MAKKTEKKEEVKTSPSAKKETVYKVVKCYMLTGVGSKSYKTNDEVTAKCFPSEEIVKGHIANGILVEVK